MSAADETTTLAASPGGTPSEPERCVDALISRGLAAFPDLRAARTVAEQLAALEGERARFALCLLTLELARRGEALASEDLPRHVGVLLEAHRDPARAVALIAGNPALAKRWEQVAPVVAQFTAGSVDAAPAQAAAAPAAAPPQPEDELEARIDLIPESAPWPGAPVASSPGPRAGPDVPTAQQPGSEPALVEDDLELQVELAPEVIPTTPAIRVGADHEGRAGEASPASPAGSDAHDALSVEIELDEADEVPPLTDAELATTRGSAAGVTAVASLIETAPSEDEDLAIDLEPPDTATNVVPPLISVESSDSDEIALDLEPAVAETVAVPPPVHLEPPAAPTETVPPLITVDPIDPDLDSLPTPKSPVAPRPPPPPRHPTPALEIEEIQEVLEDVVEQKLAVTSGGRQRRSESERALAAFWRFASQALRIPGDGEQALFAGQFLTLARSADRSRLLRFSREALSRHGEVPVARALAGLVLLYLATQEKQRGLLGVNRERKEMIRTGLSALTTTEPAVAGHAAVLFEHDGTATRKAFAAVVDLLSAFLAFCARNQLDPRSAPAIDRFVARA